MNRENPDELIRKAQAKLTHGFFGKILSSKEMGQKELAYEISQGYIEINQ